MADATGWEWLTALATVASAVVVAVQAYYTRKAVKSSEDTVAANRDSLRIATEALRESQLARLEAGVPRILVQSPSVPDSFKTMMPSPTEEKPWGTRRITETDIFKLPRDAGVPLTVWHTFTIRNDGPGAFVPRTKPLAIPTDPNIDRIIGPGESREYKFPIRHKVSEWIDILETPRNDSPDALSPFAESARVTIQYIGSRDSDVTETHQVVVFGSVLKPVVDAEGDWVGVLNWADISLSAIVLPAERTYWRSRAGRDEF